VETYSVIHRGKRFLALHKRGNQRATRIYKDGMEMVISIGWYLANRDWRIFLHDDNAEVARVITSSRHLEA
jgi:hypothetical protein